MIRSVDKGENEEEEEEEDDDIDRLIGEVYRAGVNGWRRLFGECYRFMIYGGRCSCEKDANTKVS